MTIRVVKLDEEHLGAVFDALSQRDVQVALGLCSQPSRQALLTGEAQTYLGDVGTTHQVRWWVVERDGVPTWAAIEYGWRGALDSCRELDLFRLNGLPRGGEDFLWMLWSLVRQVMARRQSRRIRWQVSKSAEKGRFYRRLGLHELGDFELEGDVREVFELSRKRFKQVEEGLGSAEGRSALMRAWRAPLN
jgi:hypothetical protein